MRNLAFAICFLLTTTASALAQDSEDKFRLPELHTIKTVSLEPSYSCRSAADFQKGYAKTALFLSKFSRQRNSPDLLFNGACHSDDYFQAATAGDDLSLIADLGADVSVEEISASRSLNLNRVHRYSDYSKFAAAVKVIANHTYAVLINNSEKRGLFIFQVVDYVPNEKVGLRYAVKLYEVREGGSPIRAAGFDWEKTNN